MKCYVIYDPATPSPHPVIRGGILERDDDINQQAGEGQAALEVAAYDWRTPQGVDTETSPPALVALVAPPPTLDEAKTAAKASAAQRRWEIETGGVTLNGASIDTDDRSKLLLANAAEQARLDDTFTANWKTSDGSWVALDAPTILAVYAGVFAHVRACFAREQELCGLINNAASVDDVTWLDATITAFWPAQ